MRSQQLLVAILAVGVIFLSTVQGSSIDETTLTISSYDLVQAAIATTSSTIQLTPDTTSSAGRALYKPWHDVASGFTITIYLDIASAGQVGDGFGFVVTGDTNSFLNTAASAGQELNIAGLTNTATVVVNFISSTVIFCQVDDQTTIPTSPGTSSQCSSAAIAGMGVGSHTLIIEYIPNGSTADWKISIDGSQATLLEDILVVKPPSTDEYYFGWVGANGGSDSSNKTITGWFANITEPCGNNGGCSGNATCSYLGFGKVNCTCLSGFEGDGITCTEIPPPVAQPVDVPIATPIAEPVAQPINEPIAAVDPPKDNQTGPKVEVVVPAVVVPVVGAAVAIFLGVYLGKKRQKNKKTKANSDDLEDGDGATALTSTANATGIAPSNYGNVPALSDADGQYINIPSVTTVKGDKSEIEINPLGINPADIDKRMHIPYKSLVFTKEIGAGSYGKVFLGEWRGAEVAIKVNNTVTDMDGFLAEAKLTLGIAPHPNLVQTFGISLDGAYPCIVLEFCGGGSLDKFVVEETNITNAKRKEFALKIAYGLIHLHNNSIVHRDLAARNILLSTEGQPKISDFGMSRVIKDEEAKGKTKTNVGPVRWMAPESLKDKSYSVKSDVWTYGILVWEIVTGKEPHTDEDQLLVGVKIRDDALHPAIPDDCDPTLKEVMEMCWKKDPADRPTMDEIAKHLRKNPNA